MMALVQIGGLVEAFRIAKDILSSRQNGIPNAGSSCARVTNPAQPSSRQDPEAKFVAQVPAHAQTISRSKCPHRTACPVSSAYSSSVIRSCSPTTLTHSLSPFASNRFRHLYMRRWRLCSPATATAELTVQNPHVEPCRGRPAQRH
jgi:hypothetical protein